MDLPKIIHYCWFGGNPLDEKAENCIASWKKYFPDYEILRWDENNFDINCYEFTKKAYACKKWAFVSDVVRLKVIYDFGGIYFDTDVEVVAPYNDIISSDAKGFMGIETTMAISTGLGFGAERGNGLIKKLLEMYEKLEFSDYIGELSQIACPVLTTALLKENGFVLENRRQNVSGFDIFPTEYFSPIDYYTGRMRKTKNTHAIHWYSASWLNEDEKGYINKARRLTRLLGRNVSDHLIGILSCIKKEGIFSYVEERLKKYVFRGKR